MDTTAAVVTALVAVFLVLATGGAIGFWLGVKWGRAKAKQEWTERILKAKNPDLWDLGHYVQVDEAESERLKAQQAKRRR